MYTVMRYDFATPRPINTSARASQFTHERESEGDRPVAFTHDTAVVLSTSDQAIMGFRRKHQRLVEDEPRKDKKTHGKKLLRAVVRLILASESMEATQKQMDAMRLSPAERSDAFLAVQTCGLYYYM